MRPTIGPKTTSATFRRRQMTSNRDMVSRILVGRFAKDFCVGCSNMAVAFPDKSSIRQKENWYWDPKIKDFRHSTFADRLCIPESKLDIPEFKLGCKVPDHNGPLAEGWEGNAQWKNSKIDSRKAAGKVAEGEINPDDFGQWTDFANCMKDVLNIIEGL